MTSSVPQTTHKLNAESRLRIACVSFLNTRPLIYGLEKFNDLQLIPDVPSRLIEQLHDETADVALLPTIDYQKIENLLVVPVGGIGCDGPTLTVRLFSRRPFEETKILACDTDSHTSVALARIIFAERYGIRPEFIDLRAGALADTQLLIGDKVVCEEPAGFPYQLDLGQAWKDLTGLPFVFAVWVARAGINLGDLPHRLERARIEGLRHVEELVARYAIPRGWPAELAARYLTENLKFEIGERQLRAIERFHELAAKHGLISAPPRPLVIYSPA